MIAALISGGSILLEDVPGSKNHVGEGVGGIVDLEFRRVQCTPDLLPADISASLCITPAKVLLPFAPDRSSACIVTR